MQESERLAIEVLPILGEPAAAIEPSDGAFDDPSLGHDLESDCGVGSLDDFNIEMRKNLCQPGGKFRTLISAIGEKRPQERKHPAQCCHDQNASVAILDIGRMDYGMEQEP